MSLRSLLETVGPPNHAIAVVGGETADPLEGMLAETFAESSIEVGSGADDGTDTNTDTDSVGDAAVAIESEEPIDASPMAALYDSLLAINSDLFATGARGVGDVDLPAVLAGLEGVRLRLRGYPLAHKEKLLLILVSRYIEQRAWRVGDGTLYSGFQRLSRLDDEVGTLETYAELAATDVDVHVYGVAGSGSVDLDVAVHTGTGEAYRDGWFVVFQPDEPAGADPDAGPIALVSLETEPRVWDGFWTTDPDRVAEIEAFVDAEL